MTGVRSPRAIPAIQELLFDKMDFMEFSLKVSSL
jgi:hypothetical protein